MTLESPYLKPKRLEDVIAALQFLGQYGDYKLAVKDWDEKLATPPRSVSAKPGASAPSWGPVFEEHSEFFRTNALVLLCHKINFPCILKLSVATGDRNGKFG